MKTTPLRRFFEAHPDVRHHDIAREADIPLDTFRTYVNGRRKPGIDNAFAIERATKGEVPATAWLDGADAGPAAPAAGPDSSKSADAA